MTKNMYTVAGDGPCNEELALRMQAGDKNAAGRLVSQNQIADPEFEGYCHCRLYYKEK